MLVELGLVEQRYQAVLEVLEGAGCPWPAGAVACYDHGAGWRWATRYRASLKRPALHSEK